MKSHSNKSKDQFERVVDFLTEEINSLSPAELRAELDEMGVSTTDAQSIIKEAALACRQQIGAMKFAQAKQALRERATESPNTVSISIVHVRATLESYWKKNPNEIPTTLAARKGSGIPDDTALRIYHSLVQLGAIPSEDEMADV